MKVAYIAGPYRAKTEFQVQKNIKKASDLALKVWKEGAVAICPHMNTTNWGGSVYPDDPEKDSDVWLTGDLELVKRCDCIVATDDWPSSTGASGEVDLAKNKLGKPVFTESTFAEFVNWLIANDKGLKRHHN